MKVINVKDSIRNEEHDYIIAKDISNESWRIVRLTDGTILHVIADTEEDAMDFIKIIFERPCEKQTYSVEVKEMVL